MADAFGVPAADSSTLCGQQYKICPTAVAYAKEWIRKHGLDKCAPAQEILTIMEAVDDGITHSDYDVINAVAFEKLYRRAYELERAYEDCWRTEGWKRPDGKRQWKSKVKWDLCDRYYVRSQHNRATKLTEADGATHISRNNLSSRRLVMIE